MHGKRKQNASNYENNQRDHQTCSPNHKRCCVDSDATMASAAERMEQDPSSNQESTTSQQWVHMVQSNNYRTLQDNTLEVLMAQTHIVPANSRACSRCLAGEGGHINHILG